MLVQKREGFLRPGRVLAGRGVGFGYLDSVAASSKERSRASLREPQPEPAWSRPLSCFGAAFTEEASVAEDGSRATHGRLFLPFVSNLQITKLPRYTQRTFWSRRYAPAAPKPQTGLDWTALNAPTLKRQNALCRNTSPALPPFIRYTSPPSLTHSN
jgi:hypothetical protein